MFVLLITIMYSVASLGYLVPLPTKTAEFEVKNRRKSAEKAKAEHLLLATSVIFQSNKIR